MKDRNRVILKFSRKTTKLHFISGLSISLCLCATHISLLLSVAPSGLPQVVVQLTQCTKVCSFFVRYLPL